MKLSRYLCVVVLVLGAAACGSSASRTGGSGSSSGSSSASSGSSSGPSGSSSGGPVQRVAELSSEGGFVLATGLSAPQVAVYSDGSVVVSADKSLTLSSSALGTLISTLQQDLKGQPGILQPTGGPHVVDMPETVVAVRQADGGYQKVAAIDLADIGKRGGYPAPVYDAYTKLEALTSAAGAAPYTSSSVRYGFQCPAENVSEKPWPAGLPQPTQSHCSESHLASGTVATVVRNACTVFGASTPPNQPVVAYRSSHGLLECMWRYALPDEKS